MNETDSDISNKQNTSDEIDERNSSFFSSMIFRFFALMLLLALITIPVSKLNVVVDDYLKQDMTINDELSNTWGNKQTIIGPILSIPYVERISRIQAQTDSNGIKRSVNRDIFNDKTLMLLPENLRINAKLNDKTLKQDSHQAYVYEGEIELSGNFNLENLPISKRNNTIKWNKAFIAIGLNNNNSVEAKPLRWEGSSATFKPGTQLPKLLKNGFHATLGDVANDSLLPQFKLQLNLKGQESFQFAPFGEITVANVSSDSSNVKVDGDIPASSTVVTSDEFDATWRISSLKRNYPQQWLIENNEVSLLTPEHDFSSVLTGVQFSSALSTNSENYFKIKVINTFAIPILWVLFFSLFILEFKRNNKIKPKFIDYIVVSLPVLLIPLLLLTISSLTHFIQAYQIAIGSSVALIVLYLWISLRSFTRGFYILLILATLYTGLFVALDMREHILITFSAVGIVITLLFMMAAWRLKEDS